MSNPEHQNIEAAKMQPHVAILLCTYQGSAYLEKQLKTIFAQTYEDWTLYVSDDGSTDGTLALLQRYQNLWGVDRVLVFQGPRQGFAANFFSLIGRDSLRADFYAFTDQDDEWDPSKLKRAVQALSGLVERQPGLYGSRSELIDAQGHGMGHSKLFKRRPTFANALVQNMVTGNTMVLNNAAMQLMRDAGTAIHVSAHDWWAYILVTGCGGEFIYDSYPTIRYRQHGANLYGSNVSFKARMSRALRLLGGDFQQWNALNLVALRNCQSFLTAQSQSHLEWFERARKGSLIYRLGCFWRSGVYRQTWDGQLGLLVAVLTRRL